jgi:membrane-associated phospholipid phosphatase
MKKKKGHSIVTKASVTEKLRTIQDIKRPEDTLEKVSKRTYNYRREFFATVLGGVIIAFGTLMMYVKQHPHIGLDLTITKEVQEFHPYWFDLVMKFITYLGYTTYAAVIVLLTVLFIWYKNRSREAIALLLTTVGSTILSVTLKNIVHRPRPDPRLIHQFEKYIHNDSFPSGHVLFYVSFFGFLLYLTYALPKENKFRTFFIGFFTVLIILVGPSRIYLGAHWFSDVLGAYLVGFLWLSFTTYLYHRYVTHKAKL